MYSKHKLLEIYDLILAHAQQNNNTELLELADKLHTEIQAMDVQSTSDSGEGGNHPVDPPSVP
jgi:hypothetical protein